MVNHEISTILWGKTPVALFMEKHLFCSTKKNDRTTESDRLFWRTAFLLWIFVWRRLIMPLGNRVGALNSGNRSFRDDMDRGKQNVL